jgi:hypothetical protein
MALESARLACFPHLPSRLKSAYAFVAIDEAIDYRRRTGFGGHFLTRVVAESANAASCITESRLCGLQGTPRHNWADDYWRFARALEDNSPWNISLPGLLTWPKDVALSREALFECALIVQERVAIP